MKTTEDVFMLLYFKLNGKRYCVWSKVWTWFPCQIIFFRTKEFVHMDVKDFHTKPHEEGLITPETFYGEFEW